MTTKLNRAQKIIKDVESVINQMTASERKSYIFLWERETDKIWVEKHRPSLDLFAKIDEASKKYAILHTEHNRRQEETFAPDGKVREETIKKITKEAAEKLLCWLWPSPCATDIAEMEKFSKQYNAEIYGVTKGGEK